MNKQFYEAVLPPSGPYCVVGISDNAVKQTFHHTLDEIEERKEELVRAGTNAYFALASFNEDTTRSADNARELRAFFVDIDCGEGKPYPTQDDAIETLAGFCIPLELPTPLIVSSGRGIHAYWPLIDPIPTAQWRKLAIRFKQLCLTQGLHIDTTVTADPARILRCPQSYNYKDIPPREVKVLTWAEPVDVDVIEAALPPPTFDISEAKQFGVDEFTQSHGDKNFPPASFARLVRRSLKGTGCAQIAHAVKEAASLPEPLWRAALSIAWRCTDGEESIHTLSREHPGYTPEDTIEKAEKTVGPMTCVWYRQNNPTACDGCAHKVTSPILLGRKIDEAPTTDGEYIVESPLNAPEDDTPVQTVKVSIPVYPNPYFRPTNGGVYLRARDKDGDPIEIEVYPYDLYLTSRFYDYDDNGSGDGELVGLNIHSPHDGIRRITVPVSALLTKDKLRDLLLKHGVAVLNKKVEELMAYFASAFKRLQQQGSANRTRNQMGWTADLRGFVIGELEVTATTTNLAPASTAVREVVPLLVQKGTLEAWSIMVNFYAQPAMEAHAFAVFAGFGAPLLKLMGGIEVKGAAINLSSNKSGTGKTTAQMVVNSIFGHPSGLLMRKNDTNVAKMHYLGMLNTIAATMDEVTNLTDEALSELIYDVPQGRGRHRMESQSNKLRVNTSSWCTFLIMSSNSSLYDKLQRLKSTADGELRRLIEIRVQRPGNISKAQSDEVFSALNTNYGVAGPVYMRYIMNNMQEVTSLLTQTRQKLDVDLQLDQSDRFYSTVLACIITGGLISYSMGLHKIPVAPVYKFALEQIDSIRTEIIHPASDFKTLSIDALSYYINTNLSNVLVINKNGLNNLPPVPLQVPRHSLMMRFEPDAKELWIPASEFKEYLVGRQVDTRQALKEYVALGYLKNEGTSVSKRISSGAISGFKSSVTRAFCFDTDAIGLSADSFTVERKDEAVASRREDDQPARG